MTKVATLTVQKWGVVIRPTGERYMTLKERLELFDIKKHGGEVMASGREGVEKF